MTHMERPATRATRAGQSLLVSGGTRAKVTEAPGKLKAPDAAPSAQWELARDLEARARERARSALLLRGFERFQQFAIANAQASASKSLALSAGRV